MTLDSFGARGMLEVGDERYRIWRLAALQDVSDLARLPYSIKVLLENLLRHENGREISADHVAALARWPADAGSAGELAFSPNECSSRTSPECRPSSTLLCYATLSPISVAIQRSSTRRCPLSS